MHPPDAGRARMTPAWARRPRGATRAQRGLLAWLAIGLAGYVLLPWYFLQDGLLGQALPGLFDNPRSASALAQAGWLGRPWLAVVGAGLLILFPSVTQTPRRLRRGWQIEGVERKADAALRSCSE